METQQWSGTSIDQLVDGKNYFDNQLIFGSHLLSKCTKSLLISASSVWRVSLFYMYENWIS